MFRLIDEDPETLAVAWMVYWERGSAEYAHFEERQEYARYWYENLNFVSGYIWLLGLHRKKRRRMQK